ncbi:MAG: VOC family protein [Ramlibacter sp.]
MKVEPYLFLNGRADEAIEFYKKALDAKVNMLMRFKDSPEKPSAEMCMGGVLPPAESVMHSSLSIGDTQLMISDGMPGSKPEFKGFSLSLGFTDEATAKKTFAALSEGGQVQMPLAKTFYSPCFGMVADKFGVGWMVIVDDGSVPHG